MQNHLLKLLPELLEIMAEAATFAKEKANTNYTVTIKADATPVTEVDIHLSELLTANLKSLMPNVPVLSEENSNVLLKDRKDWQTYWLIDPIDGTKDFIKKTNNFSIIVALIENNRPILGCVSFPMYDTCYYAIQGYGAFKQNRLQVKQIKTKKHQSRDINLLISNSSNLERFKAKLNPHYNYKFDFKGSCGVKACLVAEGLYDGYIGTHDTSEWDLGACEIILQEAGGVVFDYQRNPFTYNQRETFVNPPFILLGDEQKLDILKQYARS